MKEGGEARGVGKEKIEGPSNACTVVYYKAMYLTPNGSAEGKRVMSLQDSAQKLSSSAQGVGTEKKKKKQQKRV